MTRSPKSKQFRRCVRAILKGCPAYGTQARLYCGKVGRKGQETRAQAAYCMRKGRKDWAASKGLHGGFEMATRRRKRRRSYGDGAAPSGGLTASKKKKLIFLGIGAVGVAAIAFMSSSSSAASAGGTTVGRPTTLAPGKSWIEGTKGYFADPVTNGIRVTTFVVAPNQTVPAAELQKHLDANIARYKAGESWIDLQDVGSWTMEATGLTAQQLKMAKATSAGF